MRIRKGLLVAGLHNCKNTLLSNQRERGRGGETERGKEKGERGEGNRRESVSVNNRERGRVSV